MESSGYISCAIQILSSRINKMNHIICNIRIVGLSWRIMNHSCISTSRTDCIKAQTFVMLKLESSGINVLSSLILINFLLFWSPSPEFNLSDTISDMTVSKSINLFISSYSSIQSYSLPLNWLFQVWKDIMIQCTFLH